MKDGYYTDRDFTPEVKARYMELYNQGLTDERIAEIMDVRRKWLNKQRQKLGLPSNCNSPAMKAHYADLWAKRMAQDGGKRPETVRAQKVQQLARQYGLPDDLCVRQIEIILTLVSGPRDFPGICAALGVKCKKGALRTRPGILPHSPYYLADLIQRGLIARVRQSDTYVYLLTAYAMSLLAGEGSKDAHAQP